MLSESTIITPTSYIASLYLRGGMAYSNGIITVPQDGLYYVYAQVYLYYSRYDNEYNEEFAIAVNGYETARSRRYDYYSYLTRQTYYMGRLLKLQNGDRISVVDQYGKNYHFNYNLKNSAFFGAFRLP